MTDDASATWSVCGAEASDVLGHFNHQLAEDEGAPLLGGPTFYVDRMRRWLTDGNYTAAIATRGTTPVAHLLWRDEPEYGDVFVRQFFVARDHRGGGAGRALFESGVAQLLPGRPLRLDVLDTNPGAAAFWHKLGFAPFSRLLQRPPT